MYINYDPGMTFNYFTARSTEVAHAFEWGNFLKCHLKGKTCSKLANGPNFHDLKKTLAPGVILTMSCGYIHAYYHSNKFISIYLGYQVSV